MISSNLLSIIPEKISRKYKVIPIELNGDTLVVGGSRADFNTIQDLNIITRKNIEFKQYPEEQIIKEIEAAYGNNIEVDEDYAYKIFETILENAVSKNVSDIHIEPFDNYLIIRFQCRWRIIWSIQIYTWFTYTTDISYKAKIGNWYYRKKTPQDGRADINIKDKLIDIRTSTIPTTYGEKTVLRILNRDNFFKTKEEIGFSQKAVQI